MKCSSYVIVNKNYKGTGKSMYWSTIMTKDNGVWYHSINKARKFKTRELARCALKKSGLFNGIKVDVVCSAGVKESSIDYTAS